MPSLQRCTLLIPVVALLALSGCVENKPSQVVERNTESDVLPLVQLENSVERLEDIRAIKRLQRAYGYYLDAGQWDAVAALFAETGQIEVGLMGIYQGRDRVKEFLYAKYGNGNKPGLRYGQLNEHAQLQPVIHLSQDGKSAFGRWRDFGMVGDYKNFAAWLEGPYENRYIKEDGIWKIAALHWFETFTVPYAGGWEHNRSVMAARTPISELPPDQAPSETYASWPGVYLPAFHYPSSGIGRPIFVPKLSGSPKLKTLRQRVQRLADREAIENLISAYGYYLDKQLWDELAQLFAEDASAEIAQRGVYHGRARIREMLNLFGPQGLENGHLHNHIQVQPVIHVDETKGIAWARSRAISQLGAFGKYGLWGDGIYENTFVKVNGVWKIKSDHLYTTFFSDYDKGFGAGARPIPGISQFLPPDAPPTEVYAALPGVYLPSFHYAHPVTGKPIANSTPLYTPQIEAAVPYRGTLAALNTRVTSLEDEIAVADLQRTYGFLVDKALWTEVSELFSENGTLEIGGRGVFVGRQRIHEYLRFLGQEGPLPGRLLNHLQLQPLVTVDTPERARARARFFAEGAFEREHKEAGDDIARVTTVSLTGTGTYENHYVKEDGVWKIEKLYAVFRMYSRAENGWMDKVSKVTRPEPSLPPDLPPTVTYDMYPHTYIAPYHYQHPVTGEPVVIGQKPLAQQ